MNKNLTLIKLGGGLIAPKEWVAETADLDTIRRLVEEINESGRRVIVVSGSGNFGHIAVKKYGIDTLAGVRKVRRSAKKIGEVVTGEMQRAGFQSQLIETHKFFGKKTGLDLRKTPVFYGDVVDVPGGGWMVYSGEKIIELLVPILMSDGWKVERIIQVSREKGVLDRMGKLVPGIDTRNWDKIKKDVSGAKGADVTGGMVHKVLESLEIARNYGIYTLIISGIVEGRLVKALEGKNVTGTVIKKPPFGGSDLP